MTAAAGGKPLGPAEDSLGTLTDSGWKRMAELQEAVASLEAETAQWREVTQAHFSEFPTLNPNP